MFPAQMMTRHRQKKVGVFHSVENNSAPDHDDVLPENQSLFKDVSIGVAIHLGELYNTKPQDLGGLNVENISNSTIVLKTNRGKYRSTLESSSIALNQYGVPHTLVFAEDGFVSDADSIVADYHHNIYLETMNQEEKDRVSYQYDLYIDNPFQEGMNLIQVYPSKPYLIDILYEHPNGENHLNGKNSRFNNCGIFPEDRAYCNLAQTSALSGPLRVKSGSKKTYVATIRLNKNGMIALNEENESFMGYVHLKFHNILISIALEYDSFLSSSMNTVGTLVPKLSNTLLEEDFNVENSKEMISQVEEMQMYNHELGQKHCEDYISDSDPVIDRLGPPYVQWLKSREIVFTQNSTFTTYDSIDFGRIAAAVGGERLIGISITNRSDKPVVIKQKFVHSHRSSKNENKRLGEPSQTMDHTLQHSSNVDDGNFSAEVQCMTSNVWIKPGETLNSCALRINLPPSDSNVITTDSIHGSVVFRVGGTLKDEYKNSNRKELNSLNDYISEIPWKVSVTEGYLEYDLRKSFFQTDLFRNGINLNCGFIERKITLKNRCTQALRMTGVHLKHENEDDFESMPDNFCRSHFSVTNFDTKRSVDQDDSWEAIGIRFAFKPSLSGDIEQLAQMRKCHIIIQTDVGGEFQMPLTIENGKIFIVPSSSIVPKECHIDNFQSCFQNAMSSVKDPLREFLSSIPNHPKDDQSQYFDPLLLDFGLTNLNSIEKEFFNVVNYNSFPLDITIDTPSYEGTQVRLGRIPYSFETFMKKIFVQGKKVPLFESSNKQHDPTLDYFRTFTYRDDIDIDPKASESLKKIYHSLSEVNVYKTKFDKQYSSDSPMVYRHDHVFFGNRSTSCKLFMETSEHTEIRELESNSLEFSQYRFSIPPGATARLEVSVMSPSIDFVHHNQAISNLVTSGTTIKTDRGQTIPIVVKYSMFSGNISVTSTKMHDVNCSSSYASIDIHPFLRTQVDAHAEAPDNTMISVQNDFNTTMEVVKVDSCNGWFEIVPSETSYLHYDDSANFFVRSIINCGDLQSFYNCMLTWLNNSKKIRERNCAFRYEEFETMFYGSNAGNRTFTIQIANGVMKNARTITDNLSKSEVRIVQPQDYDGIQNAFKLFEIMKRYDLHIIQGGLRVHLLRKNEANIPNDSPIVKTLKDAILRTELEIPTFLPTLQKRANEKVLTFPSTDVAQTNEVWLPIQNPTGHYVKVRLMIHDPDEVYVPSVLPSDGQSKWWSDSGTYVLTDESGSFIVPDHNAAVRANSAPSLHSSNAFSLGCIGRRCGYDFSNTPDNGGVHVHPRNQRRSTVGASATEDAILRGRIYSSHGILDSSYDDMDFENEAEPFFINPKTMDEVIIPPHGNATIGPFFFRPPSDDYYSTLLSLQNNITGLETFSIHGEGAIAKLAFFDKNEDADHIEMRFGKPAIIFKGEKIPGQQQEIISVYVANVGEIEVNILDMWLSSSAVNTLSSNPQILDSKCSRRGFYLIGCNSTSMSLKLLPNQQRLIHISFAQDCSFDSMYVSLIVKYESLGTVSKINTDGLLLVYNLSSDAIDKCRRSPIPASLVAVREKIKNSKWRWLFAFSTFLIPFGISILVTIDMVAFSRQSFVSSKEFRVLMRLKNKKKGTSKKTGFKNWSSAYRCLARADPNSQELVQLSKEQTRQMLLNTFKREGMIPPNCILANGTFCRDKQLIGVVSTGGPKVNKTNNQAIPPKNSISLSLCDAVFPRRRFITGCKDGLPLLPCGLGWRVYSNVRNMMTDTENKSKDSSKTSSKQMKETEQKVSQNPIHEQIKCTVPQDRIERTATNHDVLNNEVVEVRPVPTLLPESSDENKIRTSAKKLISIPDSLVEPPCKSFEVFKDYQQDTKVSTSTTKLPERKKSVERETTDEKSIRPPDEKVIDSKVKEVPSKVEKHPTINVSVQRPPLKGTITKEESNAEAEQKIKKKEEMRMSESTEQENELSLQTNVSNAENPVTIATVETISDHHIKIRELDSEDKAISFSSLTLNQYHNNMTTPKHEKEVMTQPSRSLNQNPENSSPVHSSNIFLPSSPKTSFCPPPPGLEPPPGFGSILDEVLPPSGLSLIETPNQGENILPRAYNMSSIHSLENSALADDDDEEEEGEEGGEEEAVENSFDETMDVMNFFNFLDETFDARSDEFRHLNTHDHVSEDANFAPLLFNANQNPWGGSHLPTRAGAYGFAVDEDDIAGDNDNSTRIVASSFFLNSANEDVEGKSDKAFDADAFFSDIFDDD